MPGRQEEATFATDLFDVFEMIRRESPVLFEKLNREDRVELILKVMRALDTGVTPLNEETMAAELKGFLNDAVHDKIYPARTIADNRILYCRMDSLDDASLKQLEEDLLATGRLTRKPVGSILDLRDATGSDARIAGHIAQLFSDVSADAEDSAELPAELLHFRRIPVIVMTSSGTSGSPELAAALIDCTLHGISIGQTGVGRPFQTKRANAANHVWLVPDILFSQQGISPYATPPAIPIPESIQQKAARVGISSDTDPFGTGKDSMLAYAIDLVLSLHAMRELKNGK